MRCLKLVQLAFVAMVALVPHANAGPVLVSQSPWGANHDSINMDNVFGAGHWTFYGSYASATPASIFIGSTNFVLLEGGDDTVFDLQNYLAANGPTILNWVSAGGRLLVMSAPSGGLGLDSSIIGFGPGNLIFDEPGSITNCGTMTPDGVAAFVFEPTPANQCGHALAADYVSGVGLTSFMEGDENGLPFIAGTDYGSGYIMYAGLTNSQFHDEGDPLVDDVIAFTADVDDTQEIPEPATLALFGLGLAGVGALRRRRKGLK